MKKKIWSLVLCAAMVLVLMAGLLPKTAQAAANEQLGLYFSQKAILTKDKAVTLEAGSVSGTTKIKVDGQYVDFSQLMYYEYVAGDKYSAYLSEVSIEGGTFYGMNTNVSITMDGGSVARICGGAADPGATQTGDVIIRINGGNVREVYGGNGASGTLNGNVSIFMTDGNVSIRVSPAGYMGSVVTGNAQVVITGGSVGERIPDADGSIQGTASLYDFGSNHGITYYHYYDNYVYRDGSNWYIKGDTAKALNGNSLQINPQHKLTVEEGQTLSGTVINSGTIYNYGTVESLDSEGIVYNYGNIGRLDNEGTVYSYGTFDQARNHGAGKITKEVVANYNRLVYDDSQWQKENAENYNQLDYEASLETWGGYGLPDTVTVQVGDKTLSASEYSYSHTATEGTLTVPTKNITDKMTVTATGVIDFDSKDGNFALTENEFVFTGKEHKPGLTMKGEPLSTENYNVTYENNVNAGTAKAIFTGKDGVSTGTLELEFTIEAADVADVSWTTEVVTYNGQMQYPTIAGKLGDYQLKWPEDYRNGGTGQVDKGNYTVSVEGKDNFTGTAEIPWSIKPLDIDNMVERELVLSKHVYDGTKQTATVEKLVVNGLTLKEGVDFTTEIKSGTNAGEYEFAIKGIGNYTGFFEGLYRIAPKPLTADVLEFADETITKVYDGEADINAKVQVKAGAIGNEEPKEVNGLCVYDSTWAGVATKVTFITAETELGNYIVPANLQLEKAATITPKPVKVDGVAAQNREYDGSKKVNLTPAMPWIEGIVDADLVYASVTAGQADSKNAGTRSAELTFKLEGEHAGNYCVSEDSQKTVEFEITPKSWSVTDIEVVGEDFLVTAEGILPGDDATPKVVKAIVCYGNYQVDGQAALAGEDQDNYAKLAKFSANVFRPEAGKEYTVNTNDWTNGNFIVTAAEGFTVCLRPDGTFGQNLSFGEEGENEVTFYVKSEAYDFVSRQVKETYKIDRICPTGEITIGEKVWNDFAAAEFNTYVNTALEVNISAEDGQSGVKKVEYLVSDTVQDLDQIANISGWKEGKRVTVEAEDGKRAAVYVRITDNAGNQTVICSDGFAFDTLAPEIVGVKEGVTYYVSTAVTVNDKNLVSVKLNGEEVGASFTIEGGASAEYTIVATDKAGNVTTRIFKTATIESLGEPIEDKTPENVQLSDQLEVDRVQETIDSIDQSNATEEEKAALKELEEQVQALSDRLEEVEAAFDSETINDALEVNKDNVTASDKETLEEAIAQIEKAKETYKSNLDEEEQKIIDTTVQQMRDALEAIENAEDVQKVIDALPKTADPDDEKAIQAVKEAKAAYDDLTEAEKAMVDTKALDQLMDALSMYAITKGNKGVWTGEGTLSFTANGTFTKFVGITIDGKEVDSKYYEAKAGSTIITLKESYLKKLKDGKHEFAVVYTDGAAEGSFTVQTRSTPGTGDVVLPILISVAGLALVGIIVLLIIKSRQKNK